MPVRTGSRFGAGRRSSPERPRHLPRGGRGSYFYGLPVMPSEEAVAGLRFRAVVGRGVSQGSVARRFFCSRTMFGCLHTLR